MPPSFLGECLASSFAVFPGSRASRATQVSPPLPCSPAGGSGLIHRRPSLPPAARVGALSPCPCCVYAARSKAAAEPVGDVVASGGNWRRTAVLASEKGGQEIVSFRSILASQNEQELLSGIRQEVEKGRLPLNVALGLEELYCNYRNAVLQNGDPCASDIILSNMAALFDRILLDLEDPYSFSPYHKAIREPFDYYMFGQNYIRPLIDYRRSFVGNISIFDEMEENLSQGHNVVLISNHQTEADPAVIALLLERTNSFIAESLIYVAGDRVLTDPLCKPFSMGRNLLCVYSKKHMHDVSNLVEMKKRANTKSLKEMALLLRKGSQIIWIAPSGGRDRPDLHTGEWRPEIFDASSVESIRRLVERSSVPCHLYPVALLCYEIMPPPPQVEKQIGERRTISYHGVGLSVVPEAKDVSSQALYSSVLKQYQVLKSAIHERKGIDASNCFVTISQPWE